jgi:hypothetical protein
MSKWKIEVTEKVIATNTYLVDAASEKEAKQKMKDEEIEEKISSYEEECKLLDIISIQPFKDVV